MIVGNWIASEHDLRASHLSRPFGFGDRHSGADSSLIGGLVVVHVLLASQSLVDVEAAGLDGGLHKRVGAVSYEMTLVGGLG